MLHFGLKRMSIFMLLFYIAVLAALKCLHRDKPTQHSTDDDSHDAGLANYFTVHSGRAAGGSHCSWRRRQQLQHRSPPRLLTLFTTFRHSSERRRIHRNTVENWSTLRSDGVQPMLYVAERRFNDSDWWSAVETHARRSGWIVRSYEHVSTVASRAPVLRHMFIDAQRTSRSLFYGYANGDILFDEGLATTLLEIFDDLVGSYSEVLITGVRRDCVVDADTDCDVVLQTSRSTTPIELQTTRHVHNWEKGKTDDSRRTEHSRAVNNNRKLSSEASSAAILSNHSSDIRSANRTWSAETTLSYPRRKLLDQPEQNGAPRSATAPLKNAQDYFITTRAGFPWSSIPDFVVGRAGVDNWLMVTGLARRAAVVDASATITARHQVRAGYQPSAHFTQPGGDASVNYALAGHSFDYSLGLTDCAPLETVTLTATGHQLTSDDDCPRTIALHRRPLSRYCQRAYVKLCGRRHLSRYSHNYPTRRKT